MALKSSSWDEIEKEAVINGVEIKNAYALDTQKSGMGCKDGIILLLLL